MKKLTKKQFQQALKKGLGRALLHVKEYGIGSYRDVLLKACVTDYRYDHQCEDGRASWLVEIIEASGELDFFLEATASNLSTLTDESGLAQLAGIAGILVRKGHRRLLPILYENFGRAYKMHNDSWTIGRPLIDADGDAGLRFVLTTVADEAPSDFDSEWWLVLSASDLLGAQTTRHVLDELSEKNPWLKRFRSYVDEQERLRAESKASKARKVSLEEILRLVDEKKSRELFKYRTFGRLGTQSEIEVIFSRLLKERSRERQLRYLLVFANRELPRLDPKIFEMARCPNKRVRRAARAALANSKHKSIREFALTLLREDPQAIFCDAIDLLKLNYRRGDHKSVFAALRVSRDAGLTHAVVRDLANLCGAVKDQALVRCGMWAYENTPCSICRRSFVEVFTDLNCLPQEIVEESKHDCHAGIRKLVASL